MINLKKYFLENLNEYKNTFFKILTQTKTEFSEENVHDLRVSIRRLLAFTNLIYTINSSVYAKRLKKDIKCMLKSFNELRDTQVQILKLKSFNFENPNFEFLEYHLKTSEEKLIEIAKENLSDFSNTEIQGNILFIKMQFNSLIEEYYEKLNLELILDESSKNVNIKIEEINYSDLETVHNLRIALKSYRYLTEILKVPLEIPKSKISNFKKQQNILGEIQDNYVFIKKLEDFNSIENFEHTFEIKFLITILLNERAELLKNLEKSINKIQEL